MKRLIVIAGPTASGKTSVSLNLAKHFNSEILSADSRQFYREMNIGTAKPSSDELEIVPHHFVNSLSISEEYNIGRYETDALKLIQELFKKHDQLILVGGSGLYIDAVTKGIDILPETKPEVRENLNEFYKAKGIEALQERLKVEDPEYYNIVDRNNPHRLIRALEVILISGRKFSEQRKNAGKQRDFVTKKIGLLLDREELYDRINKRVDQMIETGLVGEVERLLPYRNTNAMQTVGYKEIVEYLESKTPLETAISLIKQNTRNYAKRQMTWFRRDPEIRWFEPDQLNEMILFAGP